MDNLSILVIILIFTEKSEEKGYSNEKIKENWKGKDLDWHTCALKWLLLLSCHDSKEHE